MKNDMAKSHPDQRLPSGKPLPRGMDNIRYRQRKASVSPRLPHPFRQQTGMSEKAKEETADGERFSDFDQESILRAAWSERRGISPLINTAANSVAAGNNLDLHPLTEVRHRTKSAFCSSPWLVAGDEMYTQYVTTMGDHLASHYSFQLRYFKISEIQAIRFSQRDSKNPHKRILDILPIVDLNGLINRSHNLGFHSGLNIHTDTRFSSFGFNSIEGHITA